MKYILAALIIIGISPSYQALAQNEQWDTYMVKMGNMPASVLVDMSLLQTAPDKRFPYLVVTGPKTRNCDAHGLPGKEEIAALEDVLNATGNFLTGLTPKILSGTVTRNCQRLNYYYVKDTAGIRNALGRLYARSYKDYAYVISIKSDAGWDTYRTFLYPDEDTRTWMENDKIISRMLQQGDSLKNQRNISFSAYFRSDTDRAGFLSFARGRGYKTAGLAATATMPDAPYQAKITTYNSVKIEIINPIVQELKKEARKYYGFYSSWVAE